MPTYDARCRICGWEGEVFLRIRDRDEVRCPQGHEAERHFTRAPLGRMAGVAAKGGGPDRFTADMLGIPLKELPTGLKSEPSRG